jgi:hypothetical protein
MASEFGSGMLMRRSVEYVECHLRLVVLESNILEVKTSKTIRCLIDFLADDCPPVWGKCGHAYHMQCVVKWLESQQNARQVSLSIRCTIPHLFALLRNVRCVDKNGNFERDKASRVI